MNDSYQATYDAVRSRLSNGNIGDAVREVVRDAFGLTGHYMDCLRQDFSLVAAEMARPSVVYRPELSLDGNQWCALYGANLQEGVAGFGDTPDAAMRAFDEAWRTERSQP